MKRPHAVAQKERRIMTALGRICISFIVIAALVGIYAYRNMNYDRRALQQIQKARVAEKQAALPDG